MIEILTKYSTSIESVAAIVNSFAIIFLVFVTFQYTRATKKMADMMNKQFVYEHKPYLSVKYYQKESNTAPIFELKNHSEKIRINVRYDLFLIPPEKASNIIELQKPETLEKSQLLHSGDVKIEPNDSEGMNFNALIIPILDEMGVNLNKDYYMYGIVVKGEYTPEIPDSGSFSILEYWHVIRNVELKSWTILPLNFKIP